MEIIENILYDDIRVFIYIFFIYSFLGWCMESFGSIINPKVKKFVNRGFLIGPYCPVYGFGVVLITLLLGKYQEDPSTVFALSIFICGILEYFTSWILEKLFGARWWDYSKQKYNINGRICLETLIPFGLFGMCTLCFINPFIVDKLVLIPYFIYNNVAIALSVIFIIDGIISFFIIKSLKNITLKNVDNTEEISDMVKEKTDEIVTELVDKAEDIAMKTASDIIHYNRKRKIKKLRLKKQNIDRKLLLRNNELSKYLKKLIDELRYNTKLFNYRVKEEREKLEKTFDFKIKELRDESNKKNERRKENIEDIKKKSVWYRRIVESYPEIESIIKKRVIKDNNVTLKENIDLKNKKK